MKNKSSLTESRTYFKNYSSSSSVETLDTDMSTQFGNLCEFVPAKYKLRLEQTCPDSPWCPTITRDVIVPRHVATQARQAMQECLSQNGYGCWLVCFVCVWFCVLCHCLYVLCGSSLFVFGFVFCPVVYMCCVALAHVCVLCCCPRCYGYLCWLCFAHVVI